MHDLIVDRNVGESLDGDARPFPHTFAERNAATRHVRPRSKRRGAGFEIITQRLERRDEFVGVRRLGFWLGSGSRRHVIDCTTTVQH
jgi:hypothetical protein